MSDKQFDVLTLGRCSMDLYSQQIGAPFDQIESFATMVGGSPTNVAIGTSRLGLRSAVITAVGQDLVGDFVRRYLQDQGVCTDFVWKKNGRTALAILGVQPPDQFPLVFYRDDPPDQYITIGDMKTVPLAETRILSVAGTNFTLPNLRDASLFAARYGRKQGITVAIDLDLRPSLWRYPDALGLNMQTIWPHCDIVIGTEEELWASLADEPELIWQKQSLPANRLPELDDLIREHQQPEQYIVLKRGPRGATLFSSDGHTTDVPGFSVEVLNTVGAGDSFASGLLYGRSQGWEWAKAIRFGNACGAIVVTRHGCSSAMPTYQEVSDFIEQNGGF